MTILWHISHPRNLYAWQFIAEGYRAAFQDHGHELHILTRHERFADVYQRVRPDLFFTFVDDQYFYQLDLDLLYRERVAGNVVVFVFVLPFADLSPEVPGLGRYRPQLEAIQAGRYGDVYHSYFEEWFMREFEEVTGARYTKILLAANRKEHYPVEPDPAFACDLAFIGANLPEKRAVFERLVLPLRRRYRVSVVGRDWTLWDRALGGIEKRIHWYTQIPLRLRDVAVTYETERKLYSSAKIAINFHLDFQARFGADLNERTFRIPACGGFELCDWNAAVRNYFTADEIALAEDPGDWLSKVEHYLAADGERERMRRRASAKVLAHHTYHNRVEQVLGILRELR